MLRVLQRLSPHIDGRLSISTGSAHTKYTISAVPTSPAAYSASSLFAKGTMVVAGGVTAAWLGGQVALRSSSSQAQLPLTYEADAIREYWMQRPAAVVRRAAAIGSFALPYGAKLAVDYRNGSLEDVERLQVLAKELREILTDLGPTFIKFGQMLSIRPDILPPPFIHELQKLCDAVPSFPTSLALSTISDQLGRPVEEMFLDLNALSTPVAAASLGQVYQCHLREGGRCVAVKVQRPDMIEAVSLDLHLLRMYMHGVEFAKRNLTRLGLMNQPHPYDVALLDTFARASYLELDYLHEAASQERFRSELLPKMRGQIHVPEVVWDLTSRQVLTTEWVFGEQLAKSTPEVIQRLVPVGVNCFLMQLLDIGYFHSDPHPGNLLVTPEGKLALIDFGLCAHVAKPDSDAITAGLVHLMQGDVPALIQDAIILSFLPKDVDTTTLLPALQQVFDQGRAVATEMRRLEQEEGVEQPVYQINRRRKQFRAISNELNQVFFNYPFMVPEYFALITRALIVLEGIAVTGNKDFDLFTAAYPYAANRAVQVFGKENMSQLIGEAARSGELAELARHHGRHRLAFVRRFVSKQWSWAYDWLSRWANPYRWVVQAS